MPKQRTSTDFLCLTISAGEGKRERSPFGSPNRVDDAPNYRYRVTVRSDATNQSTYFDFHDSTNAYREGRTQLNRANLLEAFRCFVADAALAEGSFADFASELGLDSDSLEARRVYTDCKAALRKFNRLFHDGRSPFLVLDLLTAEGVE